MPFFLLICQLGFGQKKEVLTQNFKSFFYSAFEKVLFFVRAKVAFPNQS